MLMAHPAILRKLVERYEKSQLLHAERGSFETRRRLDDVAYTLCVSTGTQTVEAALATAEQQLTAALADPMPLRTEADPDVRLTA
ncbi:DUF5133 domain-containing protein [Streptomyces sp. NPDC088725]|uniref:DUF5133 domain-containing protein n=1 Tax=Streptomyces sp. NPDC088725 TaxID=3365873 RepID=UPI0037F287EF